MEWKSIIEKLDNLHETRRQMQYASLYHGTYVTEAIKLNKRLEELTGFSYEEHKRKREATALLGTKEGKR